MKKIILFYQSNIEGICTKQEETVTDYNVNLKVEHMLFNWLAILCPHIDIWKFLEVLPKKERNFTEVVKHRIYWMKHLIIETLEAMNLEQNGNEVKRTFDIKVEKL